MGQKMKNAPVYFTIAQVRHNPVLRLGAYAPDIQDRMRKAGYPDFKSCLLITIHHARVCSFDSPQVAPAIETIRAISCPIPDARCVWCP